MASLREAMRAMHTSENSYLFYSMNISYILAKGKKSYMLSLKKFPCASLL